MRIVETADQIQMEYWKRMVWIWEFSWLICSEEVH